MIFDPDRNNRCGYRACRFRARTDQQTSDLRTAAGTHTLVHLIPDRADQRAREGQRERSVITQYDIFVGGAATVGMVYGSPAASEHKILTLRSTNSEFDVRTSL